jgi:hypothetical protein
MIDALVVIILGAAGWFGAEFIGRPVRGFFDLRRKVKTLMLRFADLTFPSPPSDKRPVGRRVTDDILNARAALGDLSDELISFGQSEWLAAYFVRRLGFHPITAGRHLAALADELGTEYENRGVNHRSVYRALKF